MIYGERVRLRAAEREDIPRFQAWLNDPEVGRFLAVNLPLSLADEERWFENMQRAPAVEHTMTIEIRETDDDGQGAAEQWRAVGNISLMDVHWMNRSAEVGLFIGEKSLWDRGYGSEAIRLVLRHAFQTLNLNRVMLRVHGDNQRGIHAYEKIGFVHEGRMRQAVYSDGCYQDLLIMSVLREEWQAGQR